VPIYDTSKITDPISVAEDEHWKVEATWIGEGMSEDYQETDPDDMPLMRFDVFDKTVDKETDYYRYAPYSYCTFVLATDTEACKRFVDRVLDILQNNHDPKSELELITWWDGNESEAQRAK